MTAKADYADCLIMWSKQSGKTRKPCHTGSCSGWRNCKLDIISAVS